jgi:hypothetical protein
MIGMPNRLTYGVIRVVHTVLNVPIVAAGSSTKRDGLSRGQPWSIGTEKNSQNSQKFEPLTYRIPISQY